MKSIYPTSPRRRQNGSSLAIAIFIIVVLLGAVLSMGRMIVSNNESILYEVLGARAFLAAQSGIEYAAVRLINQPTDTECANINTEASMNLTTNGLINCSFNLSCGVSNEVQFLDETARIATITSTGQCRTIQASTAATACLNNEVCTFRQLRIEFRL